MAERAVVLWFPMRDWTVDPERAQLEVEELFAFCDTDIDGSLGVDEFEALIAAVLTRNPK